MSSRPGIKDVLIAAHRQSAPVCGQIALAIVRRKVSRIAIDAWIAELKRAISTLEGIRDDIETRQ